MTRLRALWAERNAREQRLLIMMFALLVVVGGWLLVIRPLADARAAARARLDRAVDDAGRIASAAAILRVAGSTPGAPLAAGLPGTVGQTASDAGFVLARLEPEGQDRVAFSLVSARSAALFGWIDSLDRVGIIVERINIRTNADATLGVDGVFRSRAR